MLKLSMVTAAFSVAMATAVFAGEQYVDGTGYAVSGYDVVSYFDLPQSEVGTPQASPMKGRKAFTAEYNGVTFAFASAANRDRFLTAPATFAPQYDGHCAYGVAKGGKVPGNPNLWRIVDGKLYLNITKNVVSFWEEDIPGNITLAEGNWTGIEANAASSAVIPGFSATAPD